MKKIIYNLIDKKNNQNDLIIIANDIKYYNEMLFIGATLSLPNELVKPN